MSGLTKHSREPEEGPENPLNVVASLFRSACEAMKTSELEAQARFIFAGIFPPPAASKPAEDEPEELPADMLEMQLLIDACKRGASFGWPDALHNARKRIQAGAEAELRKGRQALRAAR